MATQAERREATRSRLVEAAHRLFVAQGYEGTPTEAVLAAAGLSRGALYHHFPSKRELFAAVFDRVASEAIARILPGGRSKDSPTEALIAGCVGWLSQARRPEVATILLDQGPQVLGWQRAREIENRYSLGLMTRAVRAAVEAGELDVVSVDLAARLINAALAEIALATLDERLKIRPRVAAAAVRQLIEGFLAD